MSKFLYGIDFGTTNSALSVFDEEKKEIITTITVPSLLYFHQEQSAEKIQRSFPAYGNNRVWRFLWRQYNSRVIYKIKYNKTGIHTQGCKGIHAHGVFKIGVGAVFYDL